MDNLEEKKRQASLEKARALKEHGDAFLAAREKIPTGFKMRKEILENKKRILKVLGSSESDWDDYRWHLRNRISDVETMAKILDLSPEDKVNIDKVGEKFRWSFTPHYASLMDPEDSNCPVRLQMIPKIDELAMTGNPDFSGEEFTSPVPHLVRWYPDRVQVNTTNECAAFCRHCLRRRFIGEVDVAAGKKVLMNVFDYIRQNKEIRDVLFTGGDPLLFSNEKLDWMLTELGKIDHVEIKRLGSKVPVTLPQRIDDALCAVLEKHQPLYLNIQVNHPREICTDMAAACDRLTRIGIPLANQSVLLRNINDNSVVMKVLSHELLKVRVRPYYIYHCQGTIGIEHFRTSVEKGIEILENLRGFTSGLAIPSYIITPSGLGKTPLAPQYQVSAGEGYITLRNWEGKVYNYDNPK